MLRIPPLHLRDLPQIDPNRPIRDELNIIESHHSPPLPINRRVARTDIRNWLANRLPHGPAPPRIERPHHLLPTVGRRSRCQPERVQARNPTKISFKCRVRFGHAAPPATRRSRCPRVFRPRLRPPPRGRHSCSPRQQKTLGWRSAPSRGQSGYVRVPPQPLHSQQENPHASLAQSTKQEGPSRLKTPNLVVQ